jgi:Ca-activated chloride channel family protein
MILGVAFAAAPALAQSPADERGLAHTRTLSPYFVVDSDDPVTDRMPLLSTDVQVDVSGVIADVTVRQTYRNDGTRPLHAKYVFPASTRAAVHGLVMIIGEQRIAAKIREREWAKAEFAQAKKAGKNAALLEQQRPNVFTMNVANVMPGQQIEVELHYTELLVPEAGVYEFVYPTVVGPRYSTTPEQGAADTDLWVRSPYTPEGRAPASALRLSGTVSAGLPIDGLKCVSHAVLSQWVDSSRVHVTLDPNETNGGNRDFVLRYRMDGGKIQSGLMLYEGEDEHFFMLMVQPPRRVTAEQIPPREYVFVVDVSGSMSGFPLDTSKELLRDLIGRLRPTDSFNVLFFSGGSKVWSERSRPATQANIEDAIRMLGGQRGGGGTELLAAVRRAMDLPHEAGTSRSLIVVTDGYISAEREVFDRIRTHLGEANVFAFGIGSSVNRHLIEGIARAGEGEAFVVLGPSHASAEARRFREYVQTPVLTDIRVAAEGFGAYDLQPAAIPDLLAERPIIVRGKWRGAPAGRIAVTGVSGAGPFRQVFEVAEAEPADAHRGLRHLWARARIDEISNNAVFGEREDEKRQLIELGLRYSLLTKYTSFIAVHDVIVNPGGNGDHVSQPLPLPAGVSHLAVGGMRAGDEPGLLWMLALVLGAGTALGLALRMRRRVS